MARSLGPASYGRVQDVMNEQDLERVVAVIPVYRAPDDLPDRVRRLATQVSHVVLVDDGSGSLPLAGVDVEQIPLANNDGIAHALNIGIERARQLGATRVLTLDQDSAVPEGYVDELSRVIRSAEGRGVKVAAAVPAAAGGAKVLRTGDRMTAAPFDPIQSGQLLPVSTLDDVGPFAEDLFIDAVDSDFWLRADLRGYSFVVAESAEIEHGLGELRPVRVFGRHLVLGGRPRHVLYHSPFRTYYMVRNSALLHRRYGKSRRSWIRLRRRKMTEMVLGCIALSDDRGAQLRAVRAGFRDARRGALGKISRETLAWINGGS
jgi:rhamnosyltransferase